LLSSEQKRIEFICSFPVFQKDENDFGDLREKSAFDKMPSEEGYERRIVIEYNHKLLCRIAAGNDHRQRIEFYEEMPMSEVWEQIALNLAVS
jgi:hypothetical protein